MKIELIIVRHAIAPDEDPEKWPDDADRPLTADGARQFARAAKGIAALFELPLVVLSSPMVRARQTAEIMVERAGWPKPRIVPELGASVPAAALALRVARVRGARRAIVGHEPQLSELVEFLCGARCELKKGGLARLSVESFAERGATLQALLPARALRAAR